MTNLPGVQNEGGVLDGLWEFEGEVCVVLDGKFINMSGGTIGDMVVCNRIDRTFTLKNFHDGLVYTACWNLDATEIEWLTPTSGVWTRQQDMAGAEERGSKGRFCGRHAFGLYARFGASDGYASGRRRCDWRDTSLGVRFRIRRVCH